MPDLKPITDIATRWNSTYDIIERHLKIRPATTTTFRFNQLKNKSHRNTTTPKDIADLEAITAVSNIVAATAFL